MLAINTITVSARMRAILNLAASAETPEKYMENNEIYILYHLAIRGAFE